MNHGASPRAATKVTCWSRIFATHAIAALLATACVGAPGAGAKAGDSPDGEVGSGTLLTLDGVGVMDSDKFTATSAWTLAYSFDCSRTTSRSFVLTLYSTEGIPVAAPVIASAVSGTAEIAEDLVGTFYVGLTTECAWSVHATS
jgi:hypothetical protein